MPEALLSLFGIHNDLSSGSDNGLLETPWYTDNKDIMHLIMSWSVNSLQAYSKDS